MVVPQPVKRLKLKTSMIYSWSECTDTRKEISMKLKWHLLQCFSDLLKAKSQANNHKPVCLDWTFSQKVYTLLEYFLASVNRLSLWYYPHKSKETIRTNLLSFNSSLPKLKYIHKTTNLRSHKVSAVHATFYISLASPPLSPLIIRGKGSFLVVKRNLYFEYFK